MAEVTTLTRHRLRVPLDNADPGVLLNQQTGKRLTMYKARAAQVEFALFFDGTLQSVNQFTSVTAEIKTVTGGVIDSDSAPVASSTISASDLNNALQTDQWNAKTDQHGIIPFENAATAAFSMAGAQNNIKEFGLIVTAITTDATPKRITLGYGIINVVNDGGATSATPPPVGDPLYLTADEVVALMNSYVKIVTGPGGSVTFMNEDGYGVKIYCKPGNQPELDQVQIQPPIP